MKRRSDEGATPDLSASRSSPPPEVLARALDAAPAPALLVTTSGVIAYANRALLDATGYPAEEMVGRRVQDFLPERSFPYEAARAVLVDGRRWTGDAAFMRRDGKLYQHEVTAAPVRAQDGSITHAVILTHGGEQRQSQARLLLTDRMVSVGTLAAGVAHEINNPLAFLLTNLNFAADRLGELERSEGTLTGAALAEVRASVTEAREGAERVRDIVRDLRKFSRGDDGARTAVDVESVLESSIKMAGNEIRHRGRLVRQYGKVPRVMAEEARLGQVFLNLLLNAVQAIPDGDVMANEIRVTTRVDVQGRVVAEVRDTGEGVSDEVRERLFQPFFTTKPVGVGTGLGLYICHHIVSALGGTIEVESWPGKGSAFRVLLPPAAEVAPAPAPGPVAAPPRRGRVLVVDDEPMIGATLKRLLSAHEVVNVRSAREALAQLDSGQRFDVILCDLMMPEMSGMDLHAALSERAPDVASRMVFLTGGIFTQGARAFADRIPNPMIEKPFDAAALRSMVARLVAGGSGSTEG